MKLVFRSPPTVTPLTVQAWQVSVRSFGVSVTEDMTREFLGTFLIPSVVHQDPHYYRMEHAPIHRRIGHAIVQVFLTRSDNGKKMPNYANLVGFAADDVDAPGPDGKPTSGPQPKGMLVQTGDGHMSVETAQTVTHHVQGSITRNLLVGKDLPRKLEFTPDGHLIIRSTRPDEHWFATWAHYQRI